MTATELRLKAAPSATLPVGQIVLFQVDHFDAEERTAWSIALVGRTSERSVPHMNPAETAGRRVFLPLTSTGIYGLTLAATT